MKPICLDEDAFYELLNTVGEYMKAHFANRAECWLPEKEAMNLLNIKSKTTLQKLRDEGKIRFSQPVKKIILYDRRSILKYLEDHVINVYR